MKTVCFLLTMPSWSKEQDAKIFLAGTYCYSKPFVGTSQQNTSVWYKMKRKRMYLFIQDGILQPQKKCMYAWMHACMSVYGGRQGGERCLWGSLFPLGKTSALKRTHRLPLAPCGALPSLPLLPGNIISDAAHVCRTLITTFCSLFIFSFMHFPLETWGILEQMRFSLKGCPYPQANRPGG